MISEEQKRQMAEEQEQVRQSVAGIKHRILVLSGKGGVGKSSVAANLAIALASRGRKVGLLDVDIHGPSIPLIVGIDGFPAELAGPDRDSALLQPVPAMENLRVMSMGFLLENRETAVIWRGPMKYNVIKQFIKDVDWGELDYLIVDSPPGTGDEPLSVAQLLGAPSRAVVVTTPQELSLSDVRRCVTFCRQVQVPVLGVVENMSGFVCPHCGKQTDIFKAGGGRKLAQEMNIPFLGQIPIDPRLVDAADDGTSYFERFRDTETARSFETIVAAIVSATEEPADPRNTAGKRGRVRIAIPVTNGKLSAHFGHCEQFELFAVGQEDTVIASRETLVAPPHEPGLLPRWLADKGADMIIAGGMGSRAQGLFQQQNIKVVTGAPSNMPEAIINAYLQGSLQTGGNVCDH